MLNQKLLFAYASLSGNTDKLVQITSEILQQNNYDCDFIDLEFKKHDRIVINNYDFIIIATYTEDFGRNPKSIKDFIKHYQTELTQTEILLMGTGDTFWGEENYCGAIDRLQKFFKLSKPILKIEGYPCNINQKQTIEKWLKNVNLIKDMSDIALPECV